MRSRAGSAPRKRPADRRLSSVMKCMSGAKAVVRLVISADGRPLRKVRGKATPATELPGTRAMELAEELLVTVLPLVLGGKVAPGSAAEHAGFLSPEHRFELKAILPDGRTGGCLLRYRRVRGKRKRGGGKNPARARISGTGRIVI